VPAGGGVRQDQRESAGGAGRQRAHPGEGGTGLQAGAASDAARRRPAHPDEQSELGGVLRGSGEELQPQALPGCVRFGRYPRYYPAHLGNMMSTLYNLNFGNENIVGIGASTSICAVMGLYLANLLCLLKKGQDMHSDKQSAIRMVVSLLVISLLPGVGFFGHFGSLAGGLLLGLAVVPGEDKELVALKWAGMVLSAIYSLILLTIFI